MQFTIGLLSVIDDEFLESLILNTVKLSQAFGIIYS
jgi:hypothetical protein